MPPLPQRREKSPSYVGHQPPPKPTSSYVNNSSNGTLKVPTNSCVSNAPSTNISGNTVTSNSKKIVNGPVSGNLPLNGVGSNGNSSNNVNVNNSTVSGNQDISRRPLKERLIHMLAVKPFKKPELYQRLQLDGMKDRDKKVFMPILQQISTFKDNEYSLLRGIWNDVQEDWPFYSEQERQLMKRRKPQNLTPPGSDSSVGSGTGGLSPRSNSSVGSGHSPSSYSHLSSDSLSKSSPLVVSSGSTSEINCEELILPEDNFDSSINIKGTKRPVNGILPDSAEDYGDIPHKRTRVAHIKKPDSGSSSSSGSGANDDNRSAGSNNSKQDKDGSNSGASPHFASHSTQIAEQLSPIGNSDGDVINASTPSASNDNNGTDDVVVHTSVNLESPSNGNLVESMDALMTSSPSHQPVSNVFEHSSPQGETSLDESEPVVSAASSSWQSGNENGDTHVLSSDIEKTSRGDSDETDSVDSGNGSSSSSNSSHVTKSGPSSSIKTTADKSDVISSSVHNSDNSSSSITSGCNRVSSTTNFHSTPQSSPDSQVDAMLMQQQQQKSMNISVVANTIKNNDNNYQRSNIECNMDDNESIAIIIAREKGNSHVRDRDRRRSDRERGGKERDGVRSKDRMKKSDKKYPRVFNNRDHDQEMENSDGSSVKLSSDYPSYLKTYTTINCPEQRSKYKEDFNAEYFEYRDLHAVIDSVSKRFANLEERLRQEERGTEGYEKIKEHIVNEYYANKRNKKYQETRQKFQYLHEKLSHIKRLVADYDAHHQPEQDATNEYSTGFSRN